ncbi:MAG: hypothetical protein LBU60_04575 [Clostridiales bacterium]|jgi:ABC-type uncharacterized transport system permease subunit|nr:hypothetical protein [Clostridiales bacterium]
MNRNDKVGIYFGLVVAFLFQIFYAFSMIFDKQFDRAVFGLILPITLIQTTLIAILTRIVFSQNKNKIEKKDKKDQNTSNDSSKFKTSDEITDCQDESDTTEQ